jgi:serine/threonine protein kinase
MLYAMKMVKKSQVAGDDLRYLQVLSERNILAEMSHQYIVQLHYAFTTTNYFCLVLDLCTGGELFHYI